MTSLLDKVRRIKNTHTPNMHQRLVCIYTACVLLASCLVFDAMAQVQAVQPVIPPVLDMLTVLRFLAGILLAFIAYWTRGIEKRVQNAEHEQKQIQTQITLLREQMLRDYMTKHEIEKLSINVKQSMDRVNSRLDYMIRPGHVRNSDHDGEDGWTHRRE